MTEEFKMDHVITFETGSKTNQRLQGYLHQYPDKSILYSFLDCGLPDTLRMVYIKTDDELEFFIRNIFSSDQIVQNSNWDIETPVRIRYIDKTTLKGAAEDSLLEEVLTAEAGSEIKRRYTIEQNDRFIIIRDWNNGVGDLLNEILLFANLPKEERKRILGEKEVTQKKKAGKFYSRSM